MIVHTIVTNAKKAYTRRDKHKCPLECLSCFTFIKGKKCEGPCEGKEIMVKSVTENFTVKNVLTITLRIDPSLKISLTSFVNLLKSARIITGKYVKTHKCGYRECTNCARKRR